MKLRFIFIFLCFALGIFEGFSQDSESEYVQLIQQHLAGEREVTVSGGRVDLLTKDYAIEVDYAGKWKQAIGQALWYGLQTSKQPGIILIKETTADNKYVIQLGSALEYGGLSEKIRIWVWPDDFKLGPPIPPASGPSSIRNFWLTTSSNIRHNRTCDRYYQKSNGRICSKSEGVACKVCGG